MPDTEDRTFSVMAGGDFALIKSVEGFEDFPDFGRYQLKQASVQPGDIVVAITEGGETPFVIGTAWQGLDTGAKVFFVYNNPTEILCTHVQRSREIIDHHDIRKLDLTTGPMAITGSTRMQAVTAELLTIGSALEISLTKFLQQHLLPSQCSMLGLHLRSPQDYPQMFAHLLAQLSAPANVESMAGVVKFEEDIYRKHGLVTYIADSFLLDVLTDTTERSPTFMVPPFRKNDDNLSPRSWAFVKDCFHPTQQAWQHLLRRQPRGLQWTADTYKQLSAPIKLQADPPRLDNAEIYKFQIGNEPDPSRTDAPDSALVMVAVTQEAERLTEVATNTFYPGCNIVTSIIIGSSAAAKTGRMFHISCDLPDSPLQLWHHLAVKLTLNTISTATMVRMGRVVGNAMAWLSPSNKKLIDRGSRLISQLTGCTYDQACIALFEAMDEIESRRSRGEEVPSPVALAIECLRSIDSKSK
jgi:N-acetylmuramic acid 6-phosphate etherase